MKEENAGLVEQELNKAHTDSKGSSDALKLVMSWQLKLAPEEIRAVKEGLDTREDKWRALLGLVGMVGGHR